jgi:electron transfer flavoprotein beta subunit
LTVPYKCVVCAKQVPDTKRVTGQAMNEDGTVNRAALPAIFNPEDLSAVEQALAIRDAYGGTVAVVTMGPPTAAEILRESLYRGADAGMLITDRRAAASDTLATSYILACAVRRLQPDIVLCGRQAIDGDTAQVGPQLAQKLGLPLVTYLEELIEIKGGRLVAKRNVGAGWERVSCPLPLLVTVMETANTPRPPAAKRMMKYKKARCFAEVARQVEMDCPSASPEAKAAETKARCEALKARGLLLEQCTLDDIGADLAWCGMSGSPTKVHRIQSVILTCSGYREFPATDEGAAELIGELIEDHTIG